MERSRFWRIGAAGLAFSMMVTLCALAGGEASVDELKDRVSKASVEDRPPLCIHVCERQLSNANKLYTAGDVAKWQAALVDVAAFAEQARDSAIQSRKHEKPSEIAVRKMARKLTDLKHTVAHDDQ
jgi:hypothetical protein